MKSVMPPKESKAWFGVAPPDLSVIARARGADWLYTYLRTFYRDPKTSTGWNNAVFPNAAMPHALWTLQGERALEESMVKDLAGHQHLQYKWSQLSPGALSQAGPEPFPFFRRYDQRKDVEAPRTLQTIGGRVDVVGDAVLVDLPGDPPLRLGQRLRVQLGRCHELRPRLAQRAIVAPHLVVVPDRNDVVRRKRKFCHGRVRRSSV